MRWIGVFNLAYGTLGLAAAAYFDQGDEVIPCLWAMASGAVMRMVAPGSMLRRVRPWTVRIRR